MLIYVIVQVFDTMKSVTSRLFQYYFYPTSNDVHRRRSLILQVSYPSALVLLTEPFISSSCCSRARLRKQSVDAPFRWNSVKGRLRDGIIIEPLAWPTGRVKVLVDFCLLAIVDSLKTEAHTYGVRNTSQLMCKWQKGHRIWNYRAGWCTENVHRYMYFGVHELLWYWLARVRTCFILVESRVSRVIGPSEMTTISGNTLELAPK